MASNMYIKLDGVTGGSTSAGHEKEMEMLSWNHGFSQPTSPVRSSAGSGTVEDANHQNFSFSKYIDGASIDLVKMCWTGKQIATGVVSCYRASGAADNKQVKYLQIDMKDVIVSNYSISGGPGDVPVENISLDYSSVTYTYLPQKKEDGTGGSAKPVTHDLESRKVS